MVRPGQLFPRKDAESLGITGSSFVASGRCGRSSARAAKLVSHPRSHDPFT
jgi:hypothetical protein